MYIPGIGTLSHFRWGEFSPFSAANAIHNSLIFVPPGTHSSLLGGHKQYVMRSLPDTSTHDQQWELIPGPFDLESNTLSTGSHASINVNEYVYSLITP